MTSPLISVIIATHNREELLPQAVQSILDQTLQDFEIIIVDDCSSDNTPNVIRALEEKDDRIRAIRSNQNIGPGAARNLGMASAKGDYIAIMDDDDLSESERFEKEVSILKVRSQQIVTTPITELYSDIIQKDRRYEPDFSI